MPMKRCNNGHFFDPIKHTNCPHCGISSLRGGEKTRVFGEGGKNQIEKNESRKTQSLSTPTKVPEGATKQPSDDSNETSKPKRQHNSVEESVTRRHGSTSGKGKQAEKEGVTVLKMRASKGIDPVVGWIVCVEGQDKGRDYRIRTERNFIGRNDSNDIVIKGDDSISRERHAIISFNPRTNSFRLAPGDSRGLIYHNDDEVLTPIDLQPYDLLELGKTKLMFIPFCGNSFSWESQKINESKED